MKLYFTGIKKYNLHFSVFIYNIFENKLIATLWKYTQLNFI